MRLYPKRLRNIDDLEQEKKSLLREKKLLDEDEFLSLNGVLGKNKSGDKEKDGEWSFVDLLPISNPLVSLLVKKILKRVSKKENKKEDKSDNRKEPGIERKPDKSLLAGVATEFIGGYLKWKAIELSYKGIKYFLKKKKTSPGLSEGEVK